MSPRLAFEGQIRRYGGEAAWHFIAVPKNLSADIRAMSTGLRSAFGSLRVVATIGNSEWGTSVFADSKAEGYLLPVKAEVRRKEGLKHGDRVVVTLEIDL